MANNHMEMRSFVRPGTPPIAVLPTEHRAISTHDHDFYEIVYIVEGFCLHDVGGRSTLLMAGDVFAIRPGDQHRYMGNQDVKLYNCIFLADALGDAYEGLLKLPGMDILFSKETQLPHWQHAHLDLVERRSIAGLLREMRDERAHAQPGWELRIKAQLVCLLVDISRIFSRHYQAEGDKRPYLGYVTQALQYIDTHYTGDLSIRDVAESVGVSSDYFSRQFKQVTGIVPVEYLRRYRFARAMELLQAGQSVSEVALAVGFRNLCHFSREFKAQLGLTPSQYKKSCMDLSGEEQELGKEYERLTGEAD